MADGEKRKKLSLKRFISQRSSEKAGTSGKKRPIAAGKDCFPEKVPKEAGELKNVSEKSELHQLCQDLWAARVVYDDWMSLPDLANITEEPIDAKRIDETVDRHRTLFEKKKRQISEPAFSEQLQHVKKAKKQESQDDSYLAKPGPSGVNFGLNSKAKSESLESCPMCQTKFDARLNQEEIDFHIAKCLSNVDWDPM